MYRQFKKTFVVAIAAVFAVAPFALAAEPFSKSAPKTMQDVGATQGRDDIVTHGPPPANSGSDQDTTKRPPAGAVSEAPKTMQDVEATQGRDDIVTHGPPPANSGRDTNIGPRPIRDPEAPKTMQDVGATQGRDDIVTHGPPPSSSR